MSRRSFLLALSVLLFITGGSVASLFLLIRHEPASYRRACVPPGPVRTQRSKEFLEEFSQLLNSIQPGNERELYLKLTDEQINSYLAEGFVESGVDERLLPEGISEPRVLFEPGKIRLLFRYGEGSWSSVISIDFDVWLAKNEPNVVLMEIKGIHAGSLPVSAHSLLEKISKVARDSGIQVNWYRYHNNPTAMLRFQSDPNDTTVQLQQVQLDQGSITIRGRPVDAAGATRAVSWLLGLEDGFN